MPEIQDLIHPADLIRTKSVEYFRQKAEDYFARFPHPDKQLGKPFSDPKEMPRSLHHLGQLFAGLKLGKAQRVLDFGAGTCWLSRFLNQLGCTTVAVDVSLTALELGRRLFREYPIVGKLLDEPRFVLSDGRTIPLDDESVDRIVCFDALHHVPNQAEVLKELRRVLKTGGIAGFAEPGRYHSQSSGAQFEMANYGLLENDMILEDIWQNAKDAGFTNMKVAPVLSSDSFLEPADYRDLIEKRTVPDRLIESLIVGSGSASIFFLLKGPTAHDSRVPFGLSYRMAIKPDEYVFQTNRPVKISCHIQNTGAAVWIHRTPWGIGNVKIGGHLYDARKNLLNFDFFRSYFSHDIRPGETVSREIELTFEKHEVFYVGVDLVSESVAWFEQLGNRSKMVKLIPE